MFFRKSIYVILASLTSFSFGQKKPLKKIISKRNYETEIPNIISKKIFNKELLFPEMNSIYEKLTTSQLQKTLQKREIAEDKALNHPKEETEVVIKYKEYDAKNDYSISYGFSEKEKVFWSVINRKIEPDGNEDMKNSIHFNEGKTYYDNGNLKTKWLRFQGGLGDITTLKQFEFDKNGKLIKEFDVSKVYKLSLIDVLKILEKNSLVINFNREGGFGAEGIAPTTIQYGNTNYGKIWSVIAGADSFAAIIYDNDGKIIIHRFDSTPEHPMPFRIFSKQGFDSYYNGKTIEEVERETGLKLFVYNNNN